MAIPKATAERMRLEAEIQELMKKRIGRLNEVLEQKRITYVELEKLTGVAKSSIARYLTGQTEKIPIDFFEKVARVTDTPVEYLTCFDEQKNTPLEAFRDDLSDVLKKLDEQEIEELIHYATYLSKK